MKDVALRRALRMASGRRTEGSEKADRGPGPISVVISTAWCSWVSAGPSGLLSHVITGPWSLAPQQSFQPFPGPGTLHQLTLYRVIRGHRTQLLPFVPPTGNAFLRAPKVSSPRARALEFSSLIHQSDEDN